MSEVVVIGQENYDTSHIVEVKQQQKKSASSVPSGLPAGDNSDPSDRPVTFKPKPEERKGGEQLSAYLAFVPMNVKELMQTRFEAFFVNDSNYYLRFTYMTAEGNGWHLRCTDEVEPNTKVFIEEFGREDLNGMERVAVQLLAYKREKPFLLKPAIDVQLRIDSVKFYKLHTFQESDFFEQPALVYTIVKNDEPARPLVIDAQQLKERIYQNQQTHPQPFPPGRGVVTPSASKTIYSPPLKGGTGGRFAGSVGPAGSSPIVVDLHASELLDNTNGLTPSDILNYQLDTFRKILKEYEKQKGTKIIFVHGKGEGVLRKALINELQYRYKSYTYQDASFREYGYGATQVTIK